MPNKEKKNKSEINMDQNEITMEELEQASGGRVSTSRGWGWQDTSVIAKVIDDSDGEVVATFIGCDAYKKAENLDKRLNGRKLN